MAYPYDDPEQALIADYIRNNQALADVGIMGAGMLPGASLLDAVGQMPAVGGGMGPSMMSNIQGGNYLDALLQGTGSVGDMMMATGALAPAGAALKGLAAAGKGAKAAGKGAKAASKTSDALTVADKAVKPQADSLLQKNDSLLSILDQSNESIPQGGLLGGSVFDVSKVDASDIFGAGAQKTMYKDPNSGGYIQVLTRPDYPASVTSLEVPEAFRQQGIGGRLQAQVLKDFPSMQGQVSSKSAARSSYKQGRRPVGQPDATLDDVLRMIDEDSSVNLVSPARQQEMSGSQGGLLDTDYRGSHSAPNAEVYGATLDDLTKIMPANVYAPEGKQLYGLGDRLVDSEWRIAALKTRGKPDAEIEVYRAVPKGVKDINSGDWVTTSKTYADQHGERTLDGDYEIIKRKVKARTLSSEGYPYEFGYNE